MAFVSLVAAEQVCTAFHGWVLVCFSQLGSVEQALTDNEVFCRVVRYKTLAEETSSPSREMLQKGLAAEDTAANASVYVLLRAVDRFYATNRRYPGTLDRFAPHCL